MPKNARGLMPTGAGGPAVHFVPSNSHVSLNPDVPDPPNSTSFPMSGSYTSSAPCRPDSPVGAAGPAVQVVPSNSQVSLYGGHELPCPPNSTSLPVEGR